MPQGKWESQKIKNVSSVKLNFFKWAGQQFLKRIEVCTEGTLMCV